MAWELGKSVLAAHDDDDDDVKATRHKAITNVVYVVKKLKNQSHNQMQQTRVKIVKD